MPKIFKLLDEMSSVHRWSQVHCNKHESVLEHTAFVAIYAMYLQRHYGGSLEMIMLRSLLHDMEETATGDIPNPTKYYSSDIFEGLRDYSEESMREISDEFFDGKAYSAWACAKDRSLEGQIVAISDAAASVYKIWQEYETGNKTLLKFIPNVQKGLIKLTERVDKELKLEVDLLQVKLLSIGEGN